MRQNSAVCSSPMRSACAAARVTRARVREGADFSADSGAEPNTAQRAAGGGRDHVVFEVVVRVAILRGERGAKREGEGLSGARWLRAGPLLSGGRGSGGRGGGLCACLTSGKPNMTAWSKWSAMRSTTKDAQMSS